MVEAKSLNADIFLRYLVTGKIDTKHIVQCQYNLWNFLKKRRWCDHIAFCDEFTNHPTISNIIIQRIFIDEIMFKKFDKQRMKVLKILSTNHQKSVRIGGITESSTPVLVKQGKKPVIISENENE